VKKINQKGKAKAVWGSSPASSRFAKHLIPGTREFFEATMKPRNEYEIPWLFEIVPFNSFRNKKVLELGCGAGYDAYEICSKVADYTGIDIAPENVERTRKHLEFYGYQPTVIEGDAEDLEFDDESFDVVFSNGVLHHTPNIEKSFREAYRVLKNGGEFWVILYHRDSIFYWISLLLVEHYLKFGFLKRSFKERLSMLEYTTSNERPLVNVYSRKELKKMFSNSGFTVKSIWIRKLVKEDLPAIPLIGKLWRFIPQQWLDFVGKRFGWYIIAKTTK
jgi:ubiquinone/menaquinone biosynthesis C-methylase UbiE